MKALKKIQNNKYANQNIYHLFVQKRYSECLKLIDSCQPDEYKYFMKSLIYKQQFKLETSLELLTECQVLNKMNFTYLKGISKNLYFCSNLAICWESINQVLKLQRMRTS